GWLDEVRALLARGYGRELPSMSGLGYREIAAHLVGELGLDEALTRAKARCHRYARAQYSWFRLDDRSIEWVEAGAGADARLGRRGGERAGRTPTRGGAPATSSWSAPAPAAARGRATGRRARARCATATSASARTACCWSRPPSGPTSACACGTRTAP